MIKRTVKLSIALLIVFGSIIPLSQTVTAQESGFTETFDDSSLPGWERSEGAVVVNGMLNIEPGNFAVRFGDHSDISLSVRVNLSGLNIVFIRYYMRDEGSYAVILVEDVIILEKSLPDHPIELGVSPREVQTDEWMDIRIDVSGGDHEIFLNGQSMIQATDPEPLQAGAIGFMVDGEASAAFDDLSVSPIEMGQPGEGEPAETPIEATEVVDTGAQDDATGFDDFIQELLSSQASPLELQTFIVNLALAVVSSFILSRVYIHWGSSLSNRRRFAANFMLITVTTTFIILVVRSSVALSLGLVGALSIVRFRAAVKEPEELAYLFFAIGLGIGLGDNQRLITILALAGAIIVLGLMRIFRKRQADFNLHVTVASQNPGKVDLQDVLNTLNTHCTQVKLMRFDDTQDRLESSFLVEFRNLTRLTEAKKALRELSDSLEITFLDNKGIW